MHALSQRWAVFNFMYTRGPGSGIPVMVPFLSSRPRLYSLIRDPFISELHVRHAVRLCA